MEEANKPGESVVHEPLSNHMFNNRYAAVHSDNTLLLPPASPLHLLPPPFETTLPTQQHDARLQTHHTLLQRKGRNLFKRILFLQLC